MQQSYVIDSFLILPFKGFTKRIILQTSVKALSGEVFMGFGNQKSKQPGTASEECARDCNGVML